MPKERLQPPRTVLGELTALPQTPELMGRGSLPLLKNRTPALGLRPGFSASVRPSQLQFLATPICCFAVEFQSAVDLLYSLLYNKSKQV